MAYLIINFSVLFNFSSFQCAVHQIQGSNKRLCVSAIGLSWSNRTKEKLVLDLRFLTIASLSGRNGHMVKLGMINSSLMFSPGPKLSNDVPINYQIEFIY